MSPVPDAGAVKCNHIFLDRTNPSRCVADNPLTVRERLLGKEASESSGFEDDVIAACRRRENQPVRGCLERLPRHMPEAKIWGFRLNAINFAAGVKDGPE